MTQECNRIVQMSQIEILALSNLDCGGVDIHFVPV
jgi:hypothetical protein